MGAGADRGVGARGVARVQFVEGWHTYNLCSSPPAFCSLDLPKKVYRFGISQPKLLTLAPDLYRAVAPLGLEGLRRGFRLGLG